MSKKKSKATKKSSAKKSKKTTNKKEAIEMESQIQEPVNIASIPTERHSETQPGTKTEAKKKVPSGKGKDENGFTTGSKSSLIYSLLAAGKYTRESILKMLDEKFPGSKNKNTLSTFLSDLQQPVKTYSSSRGIKISTAEDGVLFIER